MGNLKITRIAAVSALSAILWMCSEDKNPLPSKAHPESWNQTVSPDFHGKKVLLVGAVSCERCHGTDFSGGASGVSCAKCHASYPHPEDWMVPARDQFHGIFLKNIDYGLENCQTCHGEDHQGGRADVSCFKCHPSYPHGARWKIADEDEFHGRYVRDNNWSSADCRACHGEDYNGGTSRISCYTCHKSYPHADGWTSKADGAFHGRFIRSANWTMTSCQNCHGMDYSGGTSESSCTTCHSDVGGPEACNVCHGSSDNSAPPRDLSDNTETTSIGVGAHQLHFKIFNNCSVCHVMPSSFDDPSHIDDTMFAEVRENWGWNRETARCTQACHSDPDENYIWNDF